MIDERYVRYLSRFFFAPGYEPEDLAQEARIAMWLAPCGIERLCARRRLIEIVRRSKRRPIFCELVEAESPVDVVDLVAARDRLREIARAPLSELERKAISRVARGDTCPGPVLDNALYRARRKLAA